jgi:5'-nucleotidase
MADNRQKLAVLYTNDIHSYFERMPKVASVLEQLRSVHSENSLLVVDCGDHIDRMRMETEGTCGKANIDVLNSCGYEAIVLGNNEGLTYTFDEIADTYANAQFQIIGSNLRNGLTGELPSWMNHYCIMKKNGLRIGLIGVTAYYPEFYTLIGWKVLDPLEVTAKLVKRIRNDTDIVIVLSHLGLSQDKRMAETVQGIDLILGGHSHHLLEEPLRIQNTYLCAAGKHGQYVGEAVLEYDSEEHRLINITGRVIPVDCYPDSVQIAGIIQQHRVTGHKRLSAVVAELEEPLANEWGHESPMGNLLAAGLRRWSDADIGLVNAGQILEPLQAGEVTLERLLSICPHPINPCRITLTGEQIWKALEESLLEEYTSLPIRGFGFRGQVLGALCLDGAEVLYNPNGPRYGKIESIHLKDSLLQKEQIYQVGTIDMFTFGIGYLSLREGTNRTYYMPEFLRDVLAKQLSTPEELQLCKKTHWIRAGQPF